MLATGRKGRTHSFGGEMRVWALWSFWVVLAAGCGSGSDGQAGADSRRETLTPDVGDLAGTVEVIDLAGGEGLPDNDLASVCQTLELPSSGATTALCHAGDAPIYPFPSDRFTREVPEHLTGLGVEINVGDNLLCDDALPFLMPAKQMSQMLARHDGFSVLTPILLPFAGALDSDSYQPSAEPEAAKPAVFLVKLEADGSCPTRVPFSVTTLEGQGPDKAWTVLLVRPETVLQEAARYAAVATNRVRGADGLPVAPDPDFVMPPELECMQQWGQPLCPAEVVSATLFTTGAPSASLGGIRTWLSQQGYPKSVEYAEVGYARDVDFWPSEIAPWGETAIYVKGRFLAPDLRTPDGDMSLVAGDTPLSAADITVPFLLVMPESSVPGPWRLAVMAHGLHGSKERIGYLAQRFGEAGFVLAAIDAPGHGELEGTGNFDTYEIPPLRGSYRQGHVNLLCLFDVLRLLADQESEVYQGFLAGAPELDTTQGFAYVGESMGGIMGSAVCAVEPLVSSVVLNVTGGGLSSFLLSYFEPLVPANKAYMVRATEALAQPLMDLLDPVAFAPAMLGTDSRSLLLQAVVDDDTVSNSSTNRLAAALGLTQVCPCPVQVPGIPQQPAPASLNALTYFADAAHGFLLKNASNPDATDRARRQAAHFLRTGLVDSGEVLAY